MGRRVMRENGRVERKSAEERMESWSAGRQERLVVRSEGGKVRHMRSDHWAVLTLQRYREIIWALFVTYFNTE